MPDYKLVKTSSIKEIANDIRTNSGKTGNLIFPEGFKTGISDVKINGRNEMFGNATGITTLENVPITSSTKPYTFAGLTGLRSISIIPSSAVRYNILPAYCFYGCIELTNVEYTNQGNAMSASNGSEFEACYSLKSIDISARNNIGSRTFYDCRSLTNVNLVQYSSVEKIGSEAFKGCIRYVDGVIGDRTSYIGNNAYEGTPIVNINLSQCKTSLFIGSEAFKSCHQARTLSINSDAKIGERAFSGLYITSIDYVQKSSGGTIGAYAFSGCKSLQEVYIPDGVISIGEGAFSECVNLKKISIPSSVESIGTKAFYSTQLEEIEFRDEANSKLERIGDSAFEGTKITSIIIPRLCESIGSRSFFGCDMLTSLTFNEVNHNTNKLKVIGDRALYGTISLENVTIPSAVTDIGGYAFGNSGITYCRFLSSKPPTITSTIFYATVSNLEAIYVPAGLVSVYSTASNFSKSEYKSLIKEWNSSVGG